MSEQEILEGNKLIAEFMGEKLHINTKEENEFYVGFDEIAFDIQFLKYDHSKVKGRFTERVPLRKLYYHTSWDWLMRVVEKIEINCKFDVHIYGHYNWKKPNRCVILDWRDKEIVSTSNDSKIQCVFDAVVKFIKWYNQHNYSVNT